MAITITKPEINLREKLKELDFETVPFQKMPSGSVIQVVQGSTTIETQTSSTSYVSTALSASITPLAASSKVFVVVSGPLDNKGSSREPYLSIFRDATNIIGGDRNAFAGDFNSGDRQISNTIGQILDQPNTSFSVTYELRIRSLSGDVVSFNGSLSEAFITLMEIAG